MQGRVDEIEAIFNLLNYRPSKKELQQSLAFFGEERAEVRGMIEKLSWNESKEEQEKAIDYLSENLLPCEYIYLVLPDKYTVASNAHHTQYYKHRTGKARWENAAKMIVKIGWPKVDHILIPLFIWLIDPNWPGSKLIYDFLLSLPQHVLKSKMKEILENPQYYENSVYEDLKMQINDLCQDANISRID